MMLLLQDVAVKFQQEPLLVPAATVWKTVGGLIGSMALVLWRLGKYLWEKHKEDIRLIRSDITEMDKEIRTQFDEVKDVQDAIIQSTVKLEDYQNNRKEIRDSIHDLHIKVDGHHKEQMAALISILKGNRGSVD